VIAENLPSSNYSKKLLEKFVAGVALSSAAELTGMNGNTAIMSFTSFERSAP